MTTDPSNGRRPYDYFSAVAAVKTLSALLKKHAPTSQSTKRSAKGAAKNTVAYQPVQVPHLCIRLPTG